MQINRIFTHVKRINLILMSILLLIGCGDVKVDESKSNLLEQPVLLAVDNGLEAIPTEKKLLFKKHIITKMGTQVGELLFVDGDYYEIYWGRNESKKDIKWEKRGTISEVGIKKMKRLIARDVPKYVNKTPVSSITNPAESKKWLFKILVDTKWFFYTDPPISTRAQQLRFGPKQSFERKINRTIENHLVNEYPSSTDSD